MSISIHTQKERIICVKTPVMQKAQTPVKCVWFCAFSLIELLVVMGIVGVLLVMALPSMTNLARGNHMNRAVVGVAGFLDLAREYAVSQNTYTWVALLPVDTPEPGISVVMIASKDGSNTSDGVTVMNMDGGQTYDLSTSATNLTLLRKAVSFPRATLGVLGSSPAPSIPGLVQLGAGISFRIPGGASGTVQAINSLPQSQRVVRFSPSGQAQVSGGLAQSIEVGIQSLKGAVPDTENVSAIRLSGLTGQTRVYRR